MTRWAFESHRSQAPRDHLPTLGLELGLVNLPGYSPDFNADEAIWGWTKEETTENMCLGIGIREVVQK